MNAMSPSDPESNSTLQTFFILADDSEYRRVGIANVAVANPLPFTTFFREVEWEHLLV